MSERSDWTWEASPKKEFQRRRLERCYKLDYKDIKYKEECLTQVKELKKQSEKPMSYKRRPHREPYWNFWKVVFAGWLIRYPLQILKGIGTVMVGLFLFGVLIFSSSESVEEPSPIEYNNVQSNEY